MIKGMNHCGIVVRNMDSAIDFYRDVIGLKLLDQFERDSGPISEVVGYENTHLKVAFFDIGEGHKFELLEYINPPPSGRPTEERFWGERWVGADVFLQKITNWLSLSRAVEVIEIDEGWWPHRDFSVAAGRWVWLDLRALVEEHEGGCGLARVATSARLTRLGRLIVGLGGSTGFALGLAGIVGSQPMATLGGIVLLAITRYAVLAPMRRTVGVVREAVSKVAAELGLIPMGTTEKPGGSRPSHYDTRA